MNGKLSKRVPEALDNGSLEYEIEELEAENEALREKVSKLELQVETTNALLQDVY